MFFFFYAVVNVLIPGKSRAKKINSKKKEREKRLTQTVVDGIYSPS